MVNAGRWVFGRWFVGFFYSVPIVFLKCSYSIPILVLYSSYIRPIFFLYSSYIKPSKYIVLIGVGGREEYSNRELEVRYQELREMGN